MRSQARMVSSSPAPSSKSLLPGKQWMRAALSGAGSSRRRRCRRQPAAAALVDGKGCTGHRLGLALALLGVRPGAMHLQFGDATPCSQDGLALNKGGPKAEVQEEKEPHHV